MKVPRLNGSAWGEERFGIRGLILFLALVSTIDSAARAGQPDNVVNGLNGPAVGHGDNPRDPYAGLVTDATVTFVGQEFFRAFINTWRDLPMSERYSLSIIERPSARWGSLVRVDAVGRVMFTTFLSPGRRDLIAPTGEQAAKLTYLNVVDADLQRLLFKDADLASDEL